MNTTPKFGLSGADVPSFSPPDDPEVKTQHHAHDLHETLQNRLVELQQMKSAWLSRKAVLNAQRDQLFSQHRDLEARYTTDRSSEQKQHIANLSEVNHQHQISVRVLEKRIEECLVSTDDEPEDVSEVDGLRDDGSVSDVELLEPDVDEHLEQLEERLDEAKKWRRRAMGLRQEASEKVTEMLSKLADEQARAEEEHEEAIRKRVQRLVELDREQEERIAGLEKVNNDKREASGSALKKVTDSMRQLDRKIDDRKRECEKNIAALRKAADEYQTRLEDITVRQQDRLNEAVARAQKFASEKRRCVAMNLELEILGAEKMRETIEYRTLSNDVRKMDGHLLTHITASSGGKGDASAAMLAKSNPF
jgi:hypothetical protein